jgi:hypothetical protein
MSLRARMAAVLALLLAAGAVSGEIYRWTDAQGREHFTTQLEAVPPEQREAARNRTEAAKGKVNFHQARPAPKALHAGPKHSAAPAAAPKAALRSCAAARKEVAALMKPIKYHQRKLEGHERAARDITRNEYSRRRAEIRAEKAQAWLDEAQAKLDGFRNAKRREGLEPGCLR